MILGQISLLDCAAFVVFLAPQLIIQVGIFATAKCLIRLVPFFLLQLPYQLITVDTLTPRERRPPFHAQASFFTSVVIRCVRHAFAHLPAPIGRVFFSKPVALPFARFRMLRHGFWPYPTEEGDPHSLLPIIKGRGTAQVSWLTRLALALGLSELDCHCEEKIVDKQTQLKGLWLIKDPTQKPDVVVYYLHGGGFSMGSPWFYLEFLMAWVDILASPSPATTHDVTLEKPGSDGVGSDTYKAYTNPALFALDYNLVPLSTFPTQLDQTMAGYDFILSSLDTPIPIELAGDSAGATLALSLLLRLSSESAPTTGHPLPHHATLISPWCRLISPLNADTPSDFLNREALHLYARQYVGLIDGSVTDKTAQSDGGSGQRLHDDSGNDEDYDHNVHSDHRLVDHEVDDKRRTCNPLASPGDCADPSWWRRAVPAAGMHFVHGAEEAFAPESRRLAVRISAALKERDKEEELAKGQGIKRRRGINVTEEPAQIHAFPVVALFLGEGRGNRVNGLAMIVEEMRTRIQGTFGSS